MFSSINVLKESISNTSKIRYKTDNVNVYESVLESTLDSIFTEDMNQFSDDIKFILLEETNNFWSNSINNKDMLDTFMKQLTYIIDKSTVMITDVTNRLTKYIDSINIRLNYIRENKDLIRNYNDPIQFLNKRYSYTNLRNSMITNNLILEFSKVNKCICRDIINKTKENVDIDEIFMKTRKELVNELFIYYRGNQSKPVLAGEIYPDELNVYLSDIDIYDELLHKLKEDVDLFINMLDKSLSLFTIDCANYSEEEYTFIKTILDGSIKYINNKLIKAYILDFSARADAIMEYIETNNAILLSAIDQIKGNTVSDYYVPNNTLDDINMSIDDQLDFGEITEAIEYYQSALDTHSAGLIVIEEEVDQRMMYYFSRISNSMAEIIQKIQVVIRQKLSEKINPVLDRLKSPDKVLPAFTIDNYKTFNFNHVDSVKPKEFDYVEMKEVLKSKDQFMHRYYPELQDNNEKNIYNVMIKKFMTQQTKKECTTELLNEMVDFITVDYNKHLEGLTEFRAAIDNASEQAANIAKQYDATGEKEAQQVAQKQQLISQQQAAAESTILEADTTKFEDEKKPKDGGEGDTGLMKACTVYCTIMSQLLSAKIKFLNYAYNDRMKIVWHYIVKNKLNER